jgi:hypothetical protein
MNVSIEAKNHFDQSDIKLMNQQITHDSEFILGALLADRAAVDGVSDACEQFLFRLF